LAGNLFGGAAELAGAVGRLGVHCRVGADCIVGEVHKIVGEHRVGVCYRGAEMECNNYYTYYAPFD
jgi:hypothetical protein